MAGSQRLAGEAAKKTWQWRKSGGLAAAYQRRRHRRRHQKAVKTAAERYLASADKLFVPNNIGSREGNHLFLYKYSKKNCIKINMRK